MHQAHAAINQNDLLSVIKELKDEVNSLKNKENINPNAQRREQRAAEAALKPWQYCWTHRANKSHCSANCANPMPGHQKESTLKDRKGGSAYKLHIRSVKASCN